MPKCVWEAVVIRGKATFGISLLHEVSWFFRWLSWADVSVAQRHLARRGREKLFWICFESWRGAVYTKIQQLTSCSNEIPKVALPLFYGLFSSFEGRAKSSSASMSCPASLLDFWPFLSRSESVFLFQFWTAAKEDIRRITLLKKLSSYKCRSPNRHCSNPKIVCFFFWKLSNVLTGCKNNIVYLFPMRYVSSTQSLPWMRMYI